MPTDPTPEPEPSTDGAGGAVASGAEPDDATSTGETLAGGGRKALAEERRARRDAERRAQDAEARLADVEATELRRDVAASRGLPAALASRLVGTSREELEADADQLADLLPKGPTRPPSRRPSELFGGTDPTSETPTPAAMADRILGRGL